MHSSDSFGLIVGERGGLTTQPTTWGVYRGIYRGTCFYHVCVTSRAPRGSKKDSYKPKTGYTTLCAMQTSTTLYTTFIPRFMPHYTPG